MRTITITKDIYTFDELTEEAQEKAFEYFRNLPYLFAWQEENRDTVKAIADKMDWAYDLYSYDGITYSVNYSISSDDIAELSGKRAMAYIQNNYIDAAKKPKTYWLNGLIHCDGRKNWKRNSKINYEIDNCPFTGYCMDCCFSEAWRDWQKNFSKHSTVQDFADLVADYLGRDWTADNEYQYSDDGIKDLIEANDYEFLEDGTLY